MKKIVYISLLASFALACQHVDEVSDFSNPFSGRDEIDSIVTSLLSEEGIPGASVGIAVGDTIQYLRHFGFTDTARAEAIDDSSVFPIASITKLVTAVGVLLLHEEGALSVDSSIVRYFPELPETFSEQDESPEHLSKSIFRS